MSSATRRAALTAAAAATLVGGVCLTASAASAVALVGSNQPSVVTAAPGSTAVLQWTYKNTGGSTSMVVPGGTMRFTAPSGSVFTTQTSVPTSFSSDGSTYGANNVRLTSCTVNGDKTQLDCLITSADGGTSGWSGGTLFRFSPTVTVLEAATPGASSAAGLLSFTSATGEKLTVSDGTLDLRVPDVVPTPVTTPAVAGTAVAIALAGGGAFFALRRRWV
ncbi:hypothetical protein P9139_20945 [Curtobacterium flaccumfaciens]|nr:hypothetical protein P9139_20945 [Curtobacterium flaccumfaciens]